MRKSILIFTGFFIVLSAVPLDAAGFIEIFPTTQLYEIKWYFMGNGPQEDTVSIEKEINTYLRDKGLNATIKLNCINWKDYNLAMSNIISNGERFDICVTHAPLYYRSHLAKGDFVELNDLLTFHAPNIKVIFGEKLLSKAAIDGKNYGIPSHKEKAHSWGVLLRKDLIKRYNMNISSIRKIEDLEPFFSIIKKNEPDISPFLVSNSKSFFSILDWDHLVDCTIPIALYPNNKSRKVQFELNTPQAMQFFNLIYKWRKAGYIRDVIMGAGDFRNELLKGKYFCVNQLLSPGKDAEMENLTDFSWIQIPFTEPVMSNDDLMDSMLALSATSEKPELVIRFLSLLYKDKYLNNLIKFGIEGRHYIKISENTIIKGQSFDAYNPGVGSVMGNCYLNYLWANEDPNKWENVASFESEALPLDSLGFSFNPKPVSYQIMSCQLFSEAVPVLLLSSSEDPLQILSLITNRYKNEGIAKIITEAQYQYNSWLVKNEKKLKDTHEIRFFYEYPLPR